MGDAKRRGPYEVRVEQSKAKRALIEAEEKVRLEAWWASLTPDQQKAEIAKQQKSKETRAMMRTAAGFAGQHFPK
ncbi:MAG: hypothetical protein WC406_08435 [Methanoregula sp.]